MLRTTSNRTVNISETLFKNQLLITLARMHAIEKSVSAWHVYATFKIYNSNNNISINCIFVYSVNYLARSPSAAALV